MNKNTQRSIFAKKKQTTQTKNKDKETYLQCELSITKKTIKSFPKRVQLSYVRYFFLKSNKDYSLQRETSLQCEKHVFTLYL